MAKFLPNARISFIHGQPSWVNGRLVVPMYHPAAALHQPSLKSTIIADFSALPKAIEQAKRVKPRADASEKRENTPDLTQTKPEPPAEQLSLF